MKLPTKEQISAGGVVFRRDLGKVEIAVICADRRRRWQLPKGLVESGEDPSRTAVREVREETGIESELLAPIDTIEYWYVGTEPDQRVRYHKFVHFYLLEYRAGNVSNHDREVIEARWVPLQEAKTMLVFPNEQRVAKRAESLIVTV